MSRENKLSKNKKIILISLIILGVLLIILSSFSGNNDETDSASYISEMENKLEKFLLYVEGIEDVKVIITLESDLNKSDNKSYYGNSNTALPFVRGVCVACTNGNNDKVKAEVTDIVSKYLGIGTNKVKITDIKR